MIKKIDDSCFCSYNKIYNPFKILYGKQATGRSRLFVRAISESRVKLMIYIEIITDTCESFASFPGLKIQCLSSPGGTEV